MRRADISDIEIVKAAKAWHDANQGNNLIHAPNLYRSLKESYPAYPDKIIYAAMERAARKNLIDYGTSIRGSWPTDKGLQLLAKNEAQK